MRTLLALKTSLRAAARYGAAFSKAFAVATGDVDEVCDDLVELGILSGWNDCVIDTVAEHPTSRPASQAAHTVSTPCERKRALEEQPLASFR